jgi:pimeloyl-ACP methyl ester carboxylesterase
MPTEPKRKEASVNGIRMTYWDWESNGPTILLLHNSSGFGRIWDGVARELHPDFRIVTPDLRGHGDTDKPAGGYAAEDHAADIEGLIRQLKMDWLIVGGDGLGGRVGLIYAAEHPRQVQYLLLVGGPSYISLVADAAESERVRMSVEKMRTSPRRFASIVKAKDALRNVRPYLSDAALDHILTYNTNRDAAGEVEWKYDPVAVAEGLAHMPDDLNAYVKRLECPVLIAPTEGSPEFTPERVPKIKPLFPRGQWVTIEGARMVIQLEQSVALANEIRSFVWERLD